ncbi:MAG: acyl-CoA dehydrogenase [Gammaproteobacteria bacterium]|nr:acyl-CoA dehydrogenase [Gammaproteobacteria bacterium]MDH5729126.1 acyl-CoA dehydrogenase [Gammaproteobacteria bacterium]
MITLALLILLSGILAYQGISLFGWTAAYGAFLLIYTVFFSEHIYSFFLGLIWLSYIIGAAVLNISSLRTVLITDHLLRFFKKILPAMSQTEKDALEAGTVWWDGDLFSGNPDWNKLLHYPAARLSDKEQAFIDGPVEELCAMINDWEISQELNDLPEDVWKFIKDNKFFGMIIPEEQGGLGFSHFGHSCVVTKVASRSIAAAVSIMVPNSLGPAELLMRYGTQKQKDQYLANLAIGKEVPCFALTSPEAGSDAGGIPDLGIICKQDFKGEKDVLGIRVTWNKRYITLGPVATVLGLAFQTRDPDHLVGSKEDLGITCALIPTNHEGVNIGRRHHPLGIAFQNGPNSGDDVFIPMDWVIGGQKQIGNGWRMLMECLAAGRSISLPALSVGGTKYVSRAIGAYSRIRKQFKLPIGYFEGVEEPLARMGGYAYMLDAARSMTASALDQGESPSVPSAILKYNLTERMRKAINDAMDVQGGSAICLGPHNMIGKIYQAIPISITVEGANILTRSMIIFGQGAIRCHPYVLAEMQAAAEEDFSKASRTFDNAIRGHIGFTLQNAARTIYLGLTASRMTLVPMVGPTERYYQHLTRFSAAFAFIADVAMLTYGGALKRKEKISGRLADVLSQLYLASATLKRYEEQGRPNADLPLVRWACEQCLYDIQEALYGIMSNFANRWLGIALRLLVFPLGRVVNPPSDRLGRKVARLLLAPSSARDRLTHGIYVPSSLDEPLGRLEAALTMVDEMDVIEKRMYRERKKGTLKGLDLDTLSLEAKEKGIINDLEYQRFKEYNELRKEIIAVDDFEANQFKFNVKKEKPSGGKENKSAG